jgi:hypothetical protein
MRLPIRDDRDGTLRAVAAAVFVGVLVVVASGDVGYGLIAFVTVFLGFGDYEVLRLGRQIGS